MSVDNYIYIQNRKYKTNHYQYFYLYLLKIELIYENY